MGTKSSKAIQTKRALQPSTPMLSQNAVDEWFEQDSRREDVLLLFLEGKDSNRTIATKVGCDKNTVGAWLKHPAFMQRFEVEIRAWTLRRRLRRMKQSAKMTDYLGAKAEMVIQEEAKSIAANRRNPGSAVVDNTNKLSAILRDYRAMRSEERLDAGETQVNVAHHVKAEVDVTQQLDHPFFDVISEIFGDGLLKDARISSRLDPDTLDVSAGDGLVAVLEAALVDDERILDALDTSEQDAEIEE